MSTVKKCFAEVVGCVVHASLILGVAIASGLCPEFDSFPHLECVLLCSVSVIFFMLSVEFNLVLITLPGVFFYSIALFLLCTEPYQGSRVSEGIQVLESLANLFVNVLAAFCTILKK